MHIKKLSDAQFVAIAAPWIRQTVASEIDMELLCANLKPRCEVLGDIPEQVAFLDTMQEYDTALYCNKKFKTNEQTALQALETLLPIFTELTDWTKDSISAACQNAVQALEVKNGWLLYPLGIALSGQRSTPGGGTDLAIIMGKEKTIERMNAAVALLRSVTA